MRFKSVLFEVSGKATAAAYKDTVLHAECKRAGGAQELKNTITSDHLRSGTQTAVNSENSNEVVGTIQDEYDEDKSIQVHSHDHLPSYVPHVPHEWHVNMCNKNDISWYFMLV